MTAKYAKSYIVRSVTNTEPIPMPSFKFPMHFTWVLEKLASFEFLGMPLFFLKCVLNLQKEVPC